MDSTLIMRVGMSVGGAPEGLLAQALRDAFADICRKVPVWQEDKSIVVPDDFVQGPANRLEGIDLPPGTKVSAGVGFKVNGVLDTRMALCWNHLQGCVEDVRGILKPGDSVTFSVVLVPVSEEAEIPERVEAEAGSAAVPLAASILLAMPHRPWSNPNAVALKRHEHIRELSSLIRQCVVGCGHEVTIGAGCLVDE